MANNYKNILRLTLLAGIVLTIFSGCSTKKNTALSRNWQAFNTRYNVYFNGDEHYKETLQSMESKYADDYTRLVLTHPAEAKADNKLPQPSGDFTRTIEKMQKAIQLHSIKKKPAKKSSSKKDKEFRAREEYNPFLHNAWLMMGRSQYFNGDFMGAAATFMYISRHFTWLPNVVTEAQLWEARAYCAMDWAYEAENILRLVKPDQLTTKRLKQLYNLVNANYLVRTENYEAAIPYLKDAAKGASGAQKNRLYFLLGQLYSRENQNALAYEAYRRAGSGANTDYRTKFNARIKQSEVYTGTNIAGEVRSLKSLARYSRNKEFLDQIYYAIGNLYLSRKDTAQAKENYILAVQKSTRNGIDKALANLALGRLYFDEKDYVKAQPCYSEAVPMLSNNYPGYKDIKRRSDVLDELAVYAGNVQLQDSLLTLSQMPEEEQLKVAQRLVDELKKKEKEEEEARKREEYMASQQGSEGGRGGGANAPSSFTLNSDKSWYFYNETTKNTGKTEFQKKWGARKLEDDWRRRNKQTFSLDEPTDYSDTDSIAAAPNDSIAAAQASEQEKLNDPHYVEYYLKQIPKTEAEIRTCNDIIQEGLYNMGLILKDKLDDYPGARYEFNELERRYPDNVYRLDMYYNMYLMAVREDDVVEAERYRQLIINDFPDSPYGQAMRDPQYFTKLREMNARQEGIYAEAYEAYLQDDNRVVHTLTQDMEKDYPLSKILPKFVFIDALSYLTEKDYGKFKERLEYLLQKWPDADMSEMVGGIVSNLRKGRVPQAGISNSRGILWEMRLTNDTTALGEDGLPAHFERDPEAPQYLVYAFPRDSVNANQLLFEVARFNFSSFVVKDFDLEPMSFGNVGLLVVKGFANMRELEHYRAVMARTEAFSLPPEVRPIMISKANFELLLREGRSFEEYFRFQEEAQTEATEEAVVGPDNTMPPPPDDATALPQEEEEEEAAEPEEELPLEESLEPPAEEPEPESTPEPLQEDT